MRTALVLLILLAFPAAAPASTARVTQDYGWCDDFCGKIGAAPDIVVVYDAAPGEANQLTVGREGRAITLSDSGATISVVAPCVEVDAHHASCDGGKPTPEGSDRVSVRLGDLDDVANAGALSIAMFGGAGADELISAGGRFDGGPGADRFDGGPGRGLSAGTLSFRSRREGVRADLAKGRTSDGDTLVGITAVFGGHGPDRLFGGPDDDVLSGGEGDDTLRGRAGKDALWGDRGADRLSGGDGDDGLLGGDGPDRLLGGRGADRLVGGRGRDLFDCPGARDKLSRDARDHVHACEILRRRGYTSSG
jgi:Ca2+-binding RTX toxin-like protein